MEGSKVTELFEERFLNNFLFVQSISNKDSNKYENYIDHGHKLQQTVRETENVSGSEQGRVMRLMKRENSMAMT